MAATDVPLKALPHTILVMLENSETVELASAANCSNQSASGTHKTSAVPKVAMTKDRGAISDGAGV